jgi:hypothetical protein
MNEVMKELLCIYNIILARIKRMPNQGRNGSQSLINWPFRRNGVFTSIFRLP